MKTTVKTRSNKKPFYIPQPGDLAIKEDGVIILVTASTTTHSFAGTIISSAGEDGSFPVGIHATNWTSKLYEKFEGSVTLTTE